MNTFPKRLATGIAALVTAFAFMVGGFVGQPAAHAVPADSYAPTIVDECGTENDSITFPSTLNGETVTTIKVGGEEITPAVTHNPLPEIVRLNLENFGSMSYTVVPANGPEEGLSFSHSLNDEPCPVPDPVPGNTGCVPNETGTVVDWTEIPAEYGDPAQIVDSAKVEYAYGTTATLTPGTPLEPGTKIITLYGVNGTILWDGCAPLEVEPQPDDLVVPVDDDVKLEAKDECGTANDMYRVVGTTYEGREVVKVQMSGDYALDEWIPYDADLVEMVGGVQVVLDNGNLAVIPFDLVFTDEPCEVTPEDPADDDAAQDPTDAAKDEGKKLPKTGVELTTFASLMALFGFAGAAGIAVARKRA